jgi:ATP-dependent helicase Lhr and Lhr-like helicase
VTSDADIFRLMSGGGRHLLGSFRSLTDAQRLAIPDLLDGRCVLLVARTASGKTEAVLAPLLSRASRERWDGIPSILYVSPTRALANDLHRRLSTRLAGFTSVGRRTGEYRELDSELLVTTPESLDSMLARGGPRRAHVLAKVRAVVIDELHVLAESPRGTQLQVLLARLDEVAEVQPQRAALSATVPDASALAVRFLGAGAIVRVAPGSRRLRVETSVQGSEIPRRGIGVDPLVRMLCRHEVDNRGYGPVADRLLSLRKELGGLKALVFVPSRARCDRLTADLRRAFSGLAPIPILAHHGSLDQARREETESTLAKADEGVAVATSTLEIGIDVGDIDVVVLDGPPGSVSSLLQRIGRSNRRSSDVVVLPVARNDVEACILASMLRSALDGELDPIPETSHVSVAIQQLASILYQPASGRRSRAGIEALLAAAFGDISTRIVDELLKGDWIRMTETGGIAPTDSLRELMCRPMRLHGNIGGSGMLLPLVDSVTGDPLAWVPRAQSGGRVVFAGTSYSSREREDRIELGDPEHGGTGGAIRYATRAAPITRNGLVHLARGLGLPQGALVRDRNLYVHFGGALFARVLALAGISATPLRSDQDPRTAATHDVLGLVNGHWKSLESVCGFGPFQHNLPASLRQAAVVRTFEAHAFGNWISEMAAVDDLADEQRAILEDA